MGKDWLRAADCRNLQMGSSLVPLQAVVTVESSCPSRVTACAAHTAGANARPWDPRSSARPVASGEQHRPRDRAAGCPSGCASHRLRHQSCCARGYCGPCSSSCLGTKAPCESDKEEVVAVAVRGRQRKATRRCPHPRVVLTSPPSHVVPARVAKAQQNGGCSLVLPWGPLETVEWMRPPP